MARHGFGRGEYKYFGYPLPELIVQFRTMLYPQLAEIANRWNEMMDVAFLLSQPQTDFSGGEFILIEQRPRMQSRAEVASLGQGDAIVFPVHHRPVKGTRGFYRVVMRHGVSRVRSGSRYTLGVIFHDAA